MDASELIDYAGNELMPSALRVAAVSLLVDGCDVTWSEHPEAADLMRNLQLSSDDPVSKAGVTLAEALLDAEVLTVDALSFVRKSTRWEVWLRAVKLARSRQEVGALEVYDTLVGVTRYYITIRIIARSILELSIKMDDSARRHSARIVRDFLEVDDLGDKTTTLLQEALYAVSQ